MQFEGPLFFDDRFLEVWTEKEMQQLFAQAQAAGWNQEEKTVNFLFFSIAEGSMELEPDYPNGVKCYFLWSSHQADDERPWPPAGITTSLSKRPDYLAQVDPEIKDLIEQMLNDRGRLDGWAVVELE